MYGVGEAEELIIYIDIGARKRRVALNPHISRWCTRLVGLEVGTIAANGSHMTDKRAHSGMSCHTAGSGHVLELKNTAQRSI